jgi:hypothetical protein
VGFGRLPQDIDVHDQVADFLLQLLDLFLTQRFVVLGPSSQGILGTQEEPLFPVLDLCNGQPMLSGSLLDAGLPVEAVAWPR